MTFLFHNLFILTATQTNQHRSPHPRIEATRGQKASTKLASERNKLAKRRNTGTLKALPNHNGHPQSTRADKEKQIKSEDLRMPLAQVTCTPMCLQVARGSL